MQELASLDLPQIDCSIPRFRKIRMPSMRRRRQSSWLGKYQLGYILLDQISMKYFLSDGVRLHLNPGL